MSRRTRRHLEDIFGPKGLPAGDHATPTCFPTTYSFSAKTLSGVDRFLFRLQLTPIAYDIAICLNAWCFRTWTAQLQRDEGAGVAARLLSESFERPLREAEYAAAAPACPRQRPCGFCSPGSIRLAATPRKGALVRPKDPVEYLNKHPELPPARWIQCRRLMESMWHEQRRQTSVDIFTDGACSGNPGPGGWGVIHAPLATTEIRELSGGAAGDHEQPDGADRRHTRRWKRSNGPATVRIYTDSAPIVKRRHNQVDRRPGRRNGWKTAAKKPVKNVDLWQRLESPRLNAHDIAWNGIGSRATPGIRKTNAPTNWPARASRGGRQVTREYGGHAAIPASGGLQLIEKGLGAGNLQTAAILQVQRLHHAVVDQHHAGALDRAH